MTSLNTTLTVKTRRWLRDDTDCAIVRIALPTVGLELDASLVALPLGERTCYSLLLLYDNGRQFVEYVTTLRITTTPNSPADCAQSLQAVLNSRFFAAKMAVQFVEHLRAKGLLVPQGDQP